MNEYIINSIKKFKIKNDVNSDVFIHEYYTYTYKKVKYIDIYVYKKNKNIGCININNSYPIFINFVDDNVNVLTFKYNDVKNNLYVTSYYDLNNKNLVNLDNTNLIDYNDYITDKDKINLLKSLDLKGFSNIIVLPKTTKNYYICACGTVNTSNKCTSCLASKKFIKMYDTYEKINKTYAKKQFEKYKFDSDDINLELDNFKDSLIYDGKIDINYIDDNFFKSLNDEINLKLIEYKNKSKINSTIFKCFLILIGIILMFSIISMIIYSSKFKKNKEKYISKYCSDTKYTSRSIDSIINNYKCSDYVYYITENNMDSHNIMSIINSNNLDLYSLYYDIKKENLHETYISNSYRDEKINLNRYDIFDNITYLDYLYDNNYDIDSLTIDTILLKSVIEDDKVEFLKYLKYVPLTKDKSWKYDGEIFNYYIKSNEKLAYFTNEYDIEFKPFELVDYAYSYHDIAKVNTCFTADLGDSKNIKMIMDLKGNCADKILYYSKNEEVIDNYYNAGGDMNYALQYSGNLFHELISNNSDDIDEFQERVIKLKKYGVNINYEKEDTFDGATPLDVFIGDYFNYDDCKDIKSGFTISANTVKRCENKKAKYRVLKQNGAVCKTNCEYEKYFR